MAIPVNNEGARDPVRRLLVEGRVGEITLSSSVDDVTRLVGEAEGTAPWSRKNPRPAILKYGWVQLFLDEASTRILWHRHLPDLDDR